MKSSSYLLLSISILLLFFSSFPNEVYGQGEKWYAVTQKANKKGVVFINSQGKTMLKVDTNFILNGEIGETWFENDLFILRKILNNKFISYTINRKGEVVKEFPEIQQISKISPNHFILRDRTANDYQLIDAKSLLPLDAHYKTIKYDNGIYAVVRKDGFVAFLNSEGQEYLKTEFKPQDTNWDIYNFSEGLLSVDRKIVINTKGETIFSMGGNYHVKKFSDGLAITLSNNLGEGIIDVKGNWVIKPQRQLAIFGLYRFGLILAKDSASSQYGYINPKAEWVIPPVYLDAFLFEHGKAQVDLWVEALGEKKTTYTQLMADSLTKLLILHRQLINTKGNVLFEGLFYEAAFPDDEITIISLSKYNDNYIVLNDNFKIIYEYFNVDGRIGDLYTIEKLFDKNKQKINAKEIAIYDYRGMDLDTTLKCLGKTNPYRLTFEFYNEKSGRGYAEFPLVITQMDNLQYLNLSNNQITTIPEEIIHLQNLKELNLSNNLLEKLPEAVFQLKSLQKLDISSNKFTPKEMARISQGLPNVKITFN